MNQVLSPFFQVYPKGSPVECGSKLNKNNNSLVEFEQRSTITGHIEGIREKFKKSGDFIHHELKTGLTIMSLLKYMPFMFTWKMIHLTHQERRKLL
ncbi:hypothetical protein AVEN_166253-1 [Araneus ventricosus]|uniref:Uncharacterized protein n=1 Tax=Araneus ventricosus TaxID=182803 RepID=A0A4Y2DHC8_ARAVE|nr:hypothetical protein AVEN_262838-1 [Araneus ventricosus]GBM15244.1 hypothetical protein AVEN_23566-1 [Araneus ventricosus]GBM15264.1 hypothetical protein AVEN_36557-1 [Araneus ventricosus]GBM15374.1 hypothetical protein AVEN_166253-1 [Araneus ventricosus]